MRYYHCDPCSIEFVLSEHLDKEFAPHNHARHFVVNIVKQGVLTVSLEGSEMLCQKGDVFIVPPYTVHSVCQTKEATLLSMCIGTSFVEKTDYAEAETIIRDLLEKIEQQGVIGEAQKEKLLVSVSGLYDLQKNGGRKMDEEIRAVSDKIIGCPERDMRLTTLAADTFVSKYYLIRKFKRCTGMTPHQFCIQNRIRKAQGLLRTERKVAEISAEMGFYDQSHFDKTFRKIVGISPSEYIRSQAYLHQIIQGNFLQDAAASGK